METLHSFLPPPFLLEERSTRGKVCLGRTGVGRNYALKIGPDFGTGLRLQLMDQGSRFPKSVISLKRLKDYSDRQHYEFNSLR